MKIKFRDLELAVEYIKVNGGLPESIEIEEGTNGGACTDFSFTDKNNKPTRIMIYGGHHNITPEVRVTTKLYRAPIGMKQETTSVDDI